MGIEVRIVGTIFHNWARGRGSVASVHAVGEIELETLKVLNRKIKSKRYSKFKIDNAHMVEGQGGKRMYLYLEAGRTPTCP